MQLLCQTVMFANSKVSFQSVSHWVGVTLSSAHFASKSASDSCTVHYYICVCNPWNLFCVACIHMVSEMASLYWISNKGVIPEEDSSTLSQPSLVAWSFPSRGWGTMRLSSYKLECVLCYSCSGLVQAVILLAPSIQL